MRGYMTLPLILRYYHKLSKSENEELRKILKPKKNEGSEQFKILQDEKLHDL
jgi:hypothetical protein